MPIFILIPTQGLCNRLRAIASVHILANFLNTSYFINWDVEECCNCPLELILQQPAYTPFNLSNLNDHSYFYQPNVHTNNIMNILHNYQYIVIRGGHEFKHPSMPICEFVKQKHDFYSNLLFTPSVMNIVHNTNIVPNETIGIHYRDFVHKYDNADGRVFSKISPLDDFFPIISNIFSKNPSQKFFLSSNTQYAYKQISHIIPSSNIISTNNIDFSRNSDIGVIHAAANLLMLSKCKFIVGTLMSSFSDEACFFNNISKICIGNEEISTYHCYGFNNIWDNKMLLPNFNILYDIYNNNEKEMLHQ